MPLVEKNIRCGQSTKHMIWMRPTQAHCCVEVFFTPVGPSRPSSRGSEGAISFKQTSSVASVTDMRYDLTNKKDNDNDILRTPSKTLEKCEREKEPQHCFVAQQLNTTQLKYNIFCRKI